MELYRILNIAGYKIEAFLPTGCEPEQWYIRISRKGDSVIEEYLPMIHESCTRIDDADLEILDMRIAEILAGLPPANL
ncbi:MAG TPA: hypothetical protein VJB90_04765 [Candidatus Nanoarchaeia archaeon]|nr:hypothetical protein [Candidatus Nanoarchaeia archaeon]